MVLAPIDLVLVDGDAGHLCAAGGGDGAHGAPNPAPHVQGLHARPQAKDARQTRLVCRLRGSPVLACVNAELNMVAFMSIVDSMAYGVVAEKLIWGSPKSLFVTFNTQSNHNAYHTMQPCRHLNNYLRPGEVPS